MSAAEIYQLLVIEGGMDPAYVMREMDEAEMGVALAGIHKRNRESWEQTRLLMWVIAQVNSKQKIKPQEILSFPWEIEARAEQADNGLSPEEVQQKLHEFIRRKNNASGSSDQAVVGV